MEALKNRYRHPAGKKAKVPSRLNGSGTLDESSLEHFVRLAKAISGAEHVYIHFRDYRPLTRNLSGKGGLLPRDERICSEASPEEDVLEIEDLSEDPRFRDRSFVENKPNFRYYLGVPIVPSGDQKTAGTLCLLDRESPGIGEHALEQLKLVAEGIARELDLTCRNRELEEQAASARKNIRKVAHDIRNPVAAIITGSHMMEEEEDPTQAVEYLKIIRESAQGLLDYAEERLLGS